MSDYAPFKHAADELRIHHKKSGFGKLKAGHAHEVVASFYGFNSQAAMKTSGFGLDRDDPESYREPEITFIQERVEGLGLNPLFSDEAAKVIAGAVTPACDFCNREAPTQPVLLSNPQLWICQLCTHQEDDVGVCWCCGDEYVYDVSVLNSASECPDHAGESEPLDEEEAADRESFLEYWQNHDPF